VTAPDLAPPAYVTEIWCPAVDDGVQRLHSPMKEPGPEPEMELAMTAPEPEAGPALMTEQEAAQRLIAAGAVGIVDVTVTPPDPEPQAENSQTELAPPLDVCQPFIDAARAADPALHDMDALSVLDILHERNAAEKTREAEHEYELEYESDAEPEPEAWAGDIDECPSATAAEWLAVAPEDRCPDGFEPRVDPASISERDLYAALGMPAPEPEPEVEL
jgi:hypothetical protein